MTPDSRRADASRLSQRWPRWAFLGLTIATGFGMTLFALRCRNAIEKVGVDSRLMKMVAVGCPALIGVAILVFGLALLRHGRRTTSTTDEPVSERGSLIRLTVFVVPIMVITQMAAARLGAPGEAAWSTLVLAGLVPLVPMTIFAFGVTILSASKLFGDRERGRERDSRR